MKSHAAIFLFLLLSFPGHECFAAPVVNSATGTMSDGNSIVITGSSFGSGPSVVLFDNFNAGGSAGDDVDTTATIGTWTYSNPSYKPRFDAIGRGGTGLSNCPIDYAHNTIGNALVASLTNATEVMISFAIKIPTGSSMPTAAAPETMPSVSAWKMMWLEGNIVTIAANDDIVLPTVIATQIIASGNDLQPKKSTAYIENGTRTGGLYSWWSWSNWMRMTFWLNGTTGQMYWQVATDGEGISTAYSGIFTVDGSTIFDGVQGEADPSPEQWDIIYFPWVNTLIEGNKALYDDIYIAQGANSLARVEIGDAATYSACTNLAIITPTAWSATEITATLRGGPFGSSSLVGKYIYVTDSSGNVNVSGYEILASDTTPPTVTAGVMPATSTSLIVSVTTFTATDNVGVTGYCINLLLTQPSAGSCSGTGWQGSAPASATAGGSGLNTFWFWAKDAAGNVSAGVSADTTVTVPAGGSKPGGVGGMRPGGNGGAKP